MRAYPWGTCEALSSRHSDAGALRRLLLEVAYQEIKRGTEDRYHAFRRRAGEGGSPPRPPRLGRVLMARLMLLGAVALALATGVPTIVVRFWGIVGWMLMRHLEMGGPRRKWCGRKRVRWCGPWRVLLTRCVVVANDLENN